MTNKEKMKKAIEQDFSKKNNYRKIIKKMTEEKEMKNKNNLLKWLLVPICLIALVGEILFLTYKNNNLLENKPYIDKENNIILNINDLSKIEMTYLDIDVKIVNNVSIPYPFKFDENNNQNEELFIIPNDLTQTKNSILYTKKDKDSKEYDIIANYIMLITDGNERSIEINYSKDQKPLRDYYFSEKDSKITTINGINLKIYKYEKSFYAIFSYNGYNFNIETSNITEQEFSNYLVSILK